MDVLGNDNGIINNNTGHKDQRKQRHPVERIIQQVIDQQRQGKGYRHRSQNHKRSSPAEEKPDDNRDGNNSHQQMFQKGHDLLGSCRSIIPGLSNRDVRWNNRLAEPCNPCDNLLGKQRGIAPFTLGNRQGHCRVLTRH